MRNLGFQDVFKVSRIIKKMNLKPDDLQSINSQEAMGAAVIFKILENTGDAEEEITELIASLQGVSVDTVKDYDIEKTVEVFIEIANQPGIAGFLSTVGKLMK